MLRKLIRWARVTAAGTDTSQYATQQVEYMGKVGDSFMVFPYGLHGNLPPNSLALMFSVGGNPDVRASIGWTPSLRPELKAGEVALYHPLIPDMMIYLREDGTMLVKSGVAIDVDAPEAKFTGNVTIDGNLTVAGSTALSGTVTSGGTNISNTHIHGGVEPGSGSTGTPS